MPFEEPLASVSSASIPLRHKVYELARIFLMRLRGALDHSAVEGSIADVQDYERQLKKHTGRRLENARVLEIGYGARPIRLFVALALGADITGIDLDVPLIAGSPREIINMYRRNGLERVVKSAIRFACFDLLERHSLARALRERGTRLRIDQRRLLVGDASALELTPESLDLVYSEDVFEHMPERSIRRLLPKLAAWVGHKGICLIRPNIFTGITGCHLTDWFSVAEVEADRRRRSEPWEHLRKRRFSPTGFLNGLTRVQYRQLFGEQFEIIEERVRYPNLGRRYLTPEVAKELVEFGVDELFSNQVQFVLKGR